ncbi:hypothetical protein SRB5_69840 [Streptomyces sp. RB5]|uniref:Lipoprotein n=1 Tax=Streptomyces smaragdinus TaxID=2585196 RepID=A0A7K0CTI5_9ACTN|nr:hypothetical protein [Streptomyces smaragdinus]MQY16781.1 hypothetical protein [Streptomyces smaragdinus]
MKPRRSVLVALVLAGAAALTVTGCSDDAAAPGGGGKPSASASPAKAKAFDIEQVLAGRSKEPYSASVDEESEADDELVLLSTGFANLSTETPTGEWTTEVKGRPADPRKPTKLKVRALGDSAYTLTLASISGGEDRWRRQSTAGLVVPGSTATAYAEKLLSLGPSARKGMTENEFGEARYRLAGTIPVAGLKDVDPETYEQVKSAVDGVRCEVLVDGEGRVTDLQRWIEGSTGTLHVTTTLSDFAAPKPVEKPDA